MVGVVLELAVIIISGRLVGSLFKRYLHLPRVLGELCAGMIIGPYALGRLIHVPGLGPLFPLLSGLMPVSSELQALGAVASIILLFLAGLETDLTMFVRYSVVGTLVGLAGVVFSFALGDLSAVWFGLADSFLDPQALFLGTVSTATSVGITARVMTERNQVDSPEGVTIMAAAVLDDVLGIIILAIVVGISRVGDGGGSVDWGQIALIAVKALGFWLGCTAVAVLSARRVSRLLKISHNPSTIASLAFGLALLLAGISEMAGLAMIIGAYIMGLSLSRTDLAHFLQEQLHGLYEFLVPVFFCVMGMLVDFSAMRGVVVFGLVYSVLAVAAKVGGCALLAYVARFNLRGSLRVGLGMLPRGEVALIVAAIGLSARVIDASFFGVAIMMTLITTLLAPPLLILAFEGGSGLRAGAEPEDERQAEPLSLEFPSTDIAEFLMARILKAFRQEEFFVHRLHPDTPVYQIRQEDMAFTLVQNGPEILLQTPAQHQHVARLIVLEEVLSLQSLLEATRELKDLSSMQTGLLSGMFDAPSPPSEE
jgi:Kef-type K+ transport system membrane component KefB